MPFNGIEPFVQAEQDCIFIVQFLEDTYIVLMKTKYPIEMCSLTVRPRS